MVDYAPRWLKSSHIKQARVDNCFIKNAHKILNSSQLYLYRPILTIFSLFLILSRLVVTVFGERGIIAHILRWLSQSEL